VAVPSPNELSRLQSGKAAIGDQGSSQRFDGSPQGWSSEVAFDSFLRELQGLIDLLYLNGRESGPSYFHLLESA
jgi:hypothetical protein